MFIGAHRELHPERKVDAKPDQRSSGLRTNSRGLLGPELEAWKPDGDGALRAS